MRTSRLRIEPGLGRGVLWPLTLAGGGGGGGPVQGEVVVLSGGEGVMSSPPRADHLPPVTMWSMTWCIWCHLPPVQWQNDRRLWKPNLHSLSEWYMLGSQPPHPQCRPPPCQWCMLGSQPPVMWQVKHAGSTPFPYVHRMTHRCKSITLPQTSFAGCKKTLKYDDFSEECRQQLEDLST